MLAYSYQLGLMLPGAQLASVMDAHAQACTAAGPQVCQLINVSREGDPASFISGSLNLRAQPAWLSTFMTQAETSADQAGGSVRSRSTSAEDLTRQIVDTEARLTALRTLRDRLQGILATRPGRLSDLLEVERELARVQGELDSTVSTLAVMRQRVDMAELTIQYTMEPPALTGRTGEPIRDALSGFLWTSAQNVGVIITLLAAVLPWLVLIAVCVWIARRLRVGQTWRLPWRRRSPPPPAVDAAGDGA
jgi:hypothetical protein